MTMAISERTNRRRSSRRCSISGIRAAASEDDPRGARFPMPALIAAAISGVGAVRRRRLDHAAHLTWLRRRGLVIFRADRLLEDMEGVAEGLGHVGHALRAEQQHDDKCEKNNLAGSKPAHYYASRR